MSPLLCAILLFFMPITQNKELPAQFDTIPAEVRETATVIFSGEFTQGRGPCIFMPDGSRRWRLTSGFRIKHIYRGRIRRDYIAINKVMLPESTYVQKDLERGQRYLVLLRPGKESAERIKTGEWGTDFNAAAGEEVIAIISLK